MAFERLLIWFLSSFNYDDLKDDKDLLAVNATVRMIIFDILVPAALAIFAITYSRRKIVKGFGTLSLVAYGFAGAMALSVLLHIILTASDSVGGEYRVVLAAVCILTELFNTLLVLVYRKTALNYISKWHNPII